MVNTSSTVAFLAVTCVLSMVTGYQSFSLLAKTQIKRQMALSNDPSRGSIPTSSVNAGKDWTVQALKSLSVLSAVALPLIASTKAKAVGSLYEFKDQDIIIQDIAFNVANTLQDSDAMVTLFQNNIRELRTSTANNQNVTVLGFGPDSYVSPSTFVPGISTFYEDGGHATITLLAKNLEKDSDVVEIFDKGNGLQFIKVGAEVIRLSKAIEKGADVKFAYGWVDLDTPGKIPLEVVIGLARDPVMITCLRVTNVAESTKFFIEQLGMKVLPFPISRPKGSTFEPEQVPGSSYVGYSENSMGLLLTPSPKLKAPPLNIGNFLKGFTLVFDEKSVKLPPAVVKALSTATNEIKSPDGYPFFIKGYNVFAKEATNSVEF